MRVLVGARSDIGRARERNEDAYLVREPLFAVADGMGGHRGGDVASSLALEILGAREEGEERPPILLTSGIKKANQRVLERAEADRDLRGMGTTLTAIVAEDAKAHVAHVGDSRAYLLREGNALQQLTEDHTLVQRMVREGRLSPEEAGTHPQRSVLTRALGVEEEIAVDELTLDVHSGDRLLLCTDGLTSMVGRERIEQILEGERDPQAACDRLIDAANGAGGEDNITVIVLDFLEDEGERDPAATVVKAAPREAGPSETLAKPVEHAPSEERPAPAGERTSGISRPERRRRWGRAAVWIGVAVAVLAVALAAGVVYIDRQWYVGDADGRVAIYRGIPTEILGFDLSHIEVSTELSTAQAQRLQPWRDLSEGITAGSLEAARAIVAQIRRDLQSPPGASP
jgi:serine/threonine protein phosphatase PrpC